MVYAREQMTLFSVSQLKIHNRDKFLRILLLLTRNLEMNPGPVQQPDSFSQENIYDNFKCRGMHFLHLNINSVFPKIDELRIIAKETNPSIIGLTETKIDSNVNDERFKYLDIIWKDLIGIEGEEGWHVILEPIFLIM